MKNITNLKNTLKILQEINRLYRMDYKDSTVLVPIELKLISQNLGIPVDELFGTLYYQWGTQLKKDKSFFARKGFHKCSIHFPIMLGVIAELKQQKSNSRMTLIAVCMSTIAAIAAIASAIISLLVYLQ